MVGTVIRRDVGWDALSGAVQFPLCLWCIKDKTEIDGEDGEEMIYMQSGKKKRRVGECETQEFFMYEN